MSESLDQAGTVAIPSDDIDFNAEARSAAAEQGFSAAGKALSPALKSTVVGLLVKITPAKQAEPEATIEATAEPAPRAAATDAPLNFVPFQSVPPQQKKARFNIGDNLLRVSAIALALGVGWIAGANTFDRGAEMHRMASQLDAMQAKVASVTKAAHLGSQNDLAPVKTDVAALRKSVDGLNKGLDTQRTALGTTKANLDTLKANLDTAHTDLEALKSTQQTLQSSLDAVKPDAAKPDIAKLDAAKLDRLAERIDHLEHQYSSLMPTGSVAPAAAASPVAPAPPAPASPAADSHALPNKDQRASAEKPKVPANGYVLRDVHDGMAVVEDHNGLHQIYPGQMVAGIGRIESIERRNHRWVVVTSEGVIDSDPY